MYCHYYEKSHDFYQNVHKGLQVDFCFFNEGANY